MFDNCQSSAETAVSESVGHLGPSIDDAHQAPPLSGLPEAVQLKPLSVDLDELYRRHLCRHGQFGINVLHLISVIITYVAALEILFQIPGANWIIGGIWAFYGAILAFNLHPRLFVLTNIALLGLLAIAWALPPLPLGLTWIYGLAILASHRFQLWSHSVYTEHRDLSEFQEKYPKGGKLFLVLMIYELPILLEFFLLNLKKRKHP